jgi:hypothetical protein
MQHTYVIGKSKWKRVGTGRLEQILQQVPDIATGTIFPVSPTPLCLWSHSSGFMFFAA